MFINLEMDPCILHSSPCHACVNLPSSSSSVRTSAHLRARTLLGLPLTNLPPPIAFGLPLMSVLGRYSDSCSCLRSDAPRTPTNVRARMLLGLLPMTPLGALCLSTLQILHSDVHSGICLDIRVSIHLTSPSPCLRTPFGFLSLSVLQSEPLPSNSAQTSAWASARTSVSHSILQV
jgi:hypothetical protein